MINVYRSYSSVDHKKTHAVLMLSFHHLVYVSMYVFCVKLIFFDEFKNDLYTKS